MAGMFGPKLNKVFASRWNALLWAGGVLLTAYCSVPSPDEDKAGDQAASVQTARTIAGMLGATVPAGQPSHRGPWDKDPDAKVSGQLSSSEKSSSATPARP